MKPLVSETTNPMFICLKLIKLSDENFTFRSECEDSLIR